MTDQAAKLALVGSPLSDDKQMVQIAAAYSHIAKGFWLDKRCQILEVEARNLFVADVALSTQVLRNLIVADQQMTVAEAQKLAELVQMYALKEMSANAFYGCGADAKTVVNYSVQEAVYWRQTYSKTPRKKQ